MGTDINGYVETSFNGKQWFLVAPVPDIRNYEVFEILAQVRGTEGYVTYPDMYPSNERGLPEGIIYNADDYGDHDFRCWTLDQMATYLQLWEQVQYEPVRTVWVSFIAYVAALQLHDPGAKFRFVIGFDT